jgi:hypothetical protein
MALSTEKTIMERRRRARQTTLNSYFKTKSEEPPSDSKKIQSTLTIHSQGNPLVSNAYILKFYYRMNVI